MRFHLTSVNRLSANKNPEKEPKNKNQKKKDKIGIKNTNGFEF